jgi:hypothetical protein
MKNIYKKDLINSSVNEQEANITNGNPFFKEKDISNIYPIDEERLRGKRVSRNEILDFIRKNAPITKYSLSKRMRIAYTTISSIVKEFEFCGLVKIKIVLGDNNRTHALVCLEEVENANN